MAMGEKKDSIYILCTVYIRAHIVNHMHHLVYSHTYAVLNWVTCSILFHVDTKYVSLGTCSQRYGLFSNMMHECFAGEILKIAGIWQCKNLAPS